jgi:murein DD-endopeptidase MepM/ murein hydrolase activator NlpD
METIEPAQPGPSLRCWRGLVLAGLLLAGPVLAAEGLPPLAHAHGKALQQWAAPTQSRLAGLGRPLKNLAVSSPYGMRINPALRVRLFHRGVDYAAPVGTPVYAAQDGVVEMMEGRRNFGFYVRMSHGAGVETGYAHLLRFMPGLHRGSVLRRGDVIGFVGATGLATGAHLHFEVLVQGQPVDPVLAGVAARPQLTALK